MAKSTNTTTKAVQQIAATTMSKEPVKTIAAKPEAKKLTSEPEKKKIAAKPEAKKLTAAKAPEKIATKPEPKKIKTVEPVKIEAKKEVKAEPKPSKKATVKATKIAKADVKEANAVKVETKKAKTTGKSKKAVAKTVAKEITAEAKTVKKEKATAETVREKEVKKETKKPKTVAKKAETKKATVKKPAAKTEAKPVKKAVSKKTTSEKKDVYASMNLEECIALMQTMGILHAYEDYKEILLEEADYALIEKNMIAGNGLADKIFDYDTDGFDFDLISVTLERVADTMDIKAADFAEIKKEIKAAVKTSIGKDEEKNAKEYLKEFKLAEKILMIGQRKNMDDASEVSNLIGGDIDAFMDHFFAFAYEILPTWQYDDVKFYEDFAYAVLSQFHDLYEKYQLRILIDCADLYIKHGDFQHGDENYGYILRDNQIKDYIYYRFASIYEDIDINKAKGLAYEAMQYVDDRYTYYPNIIEIMNK